VLQECHVQLYTSLSFFSLCLGEFGLLSGSDRDWFEWMGMSGDVGVGETFGTDIVIGTGGTVVAVAGENFARADGTLLDKLGGIAIVQMPQHHHRGVFGTPQHIKLVMVALTQVEKCLSIIEEFTIHLFQIVIEHFDQTTLTVFDRRAFNRHTNRHRRRGC